MKFLSTALMAAVLLAVVAAGLTKAAASSLPTFKSTWDIVITQLQPLPLRM